MGKIEITHNGAEKRFETSVEGHLAVVDYRLLRSKIALVHTGVPKAIGGRGIAEELAIYALEYAKEHDLLVLPYCPYIYNFIQDNPKYQSLVDPGFTAP